MKLYVGISSVFIILVGRCLASDNTANNNRFISETDAPFDVNDKALANVTRLPCGFKPPTREELLMMRDEEQKREKPIQDSSIITLPLCIINKRFCYRTVFIPVHVHNVHDQYETGKMSRRSIRRMVHVANRKFWTSGFHFHLKEINFVTNDAWYNSPAGSAAEIDMSTQLKVGGRGTMNVYLKVAYDSYGFYCGYAYLAGDAESVGVLDGVTIDPECAEDGKTFAHEAGHYLDLLHTFDGGCDPGDLVDDTPAELTYVGRVDGCPDTFPDTCPDKPGLDPLDNMMDYAPEGCKDRFTTGQVIRMHYGWKEFRAKK